MKRETKNQITGVSFIILVSFVFLAAANLAVQQGIVLPIIGRVGVVGSNGSSSVSSTGGSSSGSGGTLIPPNQVGFSMVIVADYTDGSTQTIATQNQGNIPTLDLVVRVNNKPIRDVTANAVVGISTPTGSVLPAGSTARFKVNFTALNENSHYVKWHYVEYTVPFVNGTVAAVYLPALAVLPVEAFSDFCSTLANGTAVCSNPGTAPAQHRVDWTILATVRVSTPTIPQFALISGTSISTAQFNADGSVTGCTNCGGSSSSTGLSSNIAAEANKDTSSLTGGKPPPEPNPVFNAGGCITLLPLLCLSNNGSGANEAVGTGVEKISAEPAVSGLEKVSGGYISLLPAQSYIPLSSSGFTTLISTNFILFMVGVSILVALAGVLLIHMLSKKKRKKRRT